MKLESQGTEFCFEQLEALATGTLEMFTDGVMFIEGAKLKIMFPTVAQQRAINEVYEGMSQRGKNADRGKNVDL